MGTPTYVKFSRVSGKPFEVLARVYDAVRIQWRSTLREVARLRPSGQEYDGGLELASGFLRCSNLAEAADLVEGAPAFGVVFLARQARAEWYLYVFDMDDHGFSVTISVESSIVHHHDEQFDDGELLEGLLTTVVIELQVAACGYGKDDAYNVDQKALDPGPVLERLRSGELLSLPRPIFHAFSIDLVTKQEIDALIEQHQPDPDPEYRQALGYHLLGRVGL